MKTQNQTKTSGKQSNPKIEWDKYLEVKKSGTQEEITRRNEIIEAYLFLLNSIAGHLAKKFPPSVSVDDCRQAGYFGLLAAVEAFCPDKKVNFVKYAAIRIKGSILDYVRSNDPLSRQMRGRQNKLNNAIKNLETELQRNPSDEEIIAELGISTDKYKDYFIASANSTTVSLSDDCFQDGADSSMRLIDFVSNQRSVDPVIALEEEEFFLDLMKGFNEKEILVMTLYYKEMLSLKEIGAVLDLSESRVSQIRAEILVKLNEMIQELKEKLVR